MNCRYVCPNQMRKKQYGFLLCKHLMKDSENYNDINNAEKVICAYQYLCPRTNRAENTEYAKECYKYHSR